MFLLAEIDALDRATGSRVTLRACSADLPDVCGWGERIWAPAIDDPGEIALRLFDGDFGAAPDVGGASFSIAEPALNNSYPDAPRLRFQGAPARLFAGVTADTIRQVLTGKVDKFESVDGKTKVSVGVDTDALGRDVLTATYAGTTGLEGGPDLKGQVKPWTLGRCLNVEPVVLDVVDNIHQVSAYGPLGAVLGLYEKGASLGPAIGDFSTFATLKAATIKEGQWGTCLAQGLIRLGAPPYGVITVDVDGDSTGGTTPRLTGAVVQRIAGVLGVPAAKIDGVSLSDLDVRAAALPGGGRIGVHLTEQTTFLDLARRLFLPLNALVGVTWLGVLFATRLATDAPVLRLDAQGRELPEVFTFAEADTSPPYKRIAMGAERVWRVQSTDEIAFYAPLVERGRFDAAETYREGQIVDLEDGSRWLFVATAPAAGQVPVVGSATWSRLSAGVALTLDQIADTANYQRPTPQEIVKLGTIAEGADVTAQNTAAAIAGQTSYATRTTAIGYDELGNVPSRLSGATLDAAFLDAGRMIYDTGQGVGQLKPAQAGADVTGQNTAADTLNLNGLASETAKFGASRGFAALDEFGLFKPGVHSVTRLVDLSLGNVDVSAATKLGGVETGATRTGAERAINRNSAFEEWAGGVPLGWTPGAYGRAAAPTQQGTATGYSPNAQRGFAIAVMPSGSAITSDGLAVTPGERLWLDYGFGFGAGYWFLGVEFLNEAGVPTASAYLNVAGQLVDSANYQTTSGAVIRGTATTLVPPGHRRARLLVLNDGPGTGGVDYFGLSRTQPGADVTASNTAAAITGQAPAATDPTIQPGATKGAPIDAQGRILTGQVYSIEVDNSLAQRSLTIGGALQIDADYQGQVLTPLPVTRKIKAIQGTTDASASATWTATFPPTLTGSINNVAGASRGTVTLTAVNGSGVVRVKATFPDGSVAEDVLEVAKVNAAAPSSSTAPAGGNTQVSDPSWNNVTSAVLAQVTDAGMTVRSASDGRLFFSATSEFVAYNSASHNIGSIASYRLVGASVWTDVPGGERAGSTSSYDAEAFQETPGFVGFFATVTGLAASTDYEVALFARRTAGTSSITFRNSSFVVKQP